MLLHWKSDKKSFKLWYELDDASSSHAKTPSLTCRKRHSRCLNFILFLVGAGILYFSFGSSVPVYEDPHPQQHVVRQLAAPQTPLLEDFQVYPPVLIAEPNGDLELSDGSGNTTKVIGNTNGAPCQVVLSLYSFANSYGKPFVGSYAPPSCSFNRVTMNLTVTSAGKQFDRLGLLYFGDTEIFRSSTAEPTVTGIEWTYLKDMTNYLSLFKESQKVIFDLGNLINDIYTAPYNVTLTATFFNAEDSIVPADLIEPISARMSAENEGSAFTFPTDASNNVTLPRNINRARFTIAACGQADEEFWWSNVFNSDVNTFPSYGPLFGYSPFRELQLFIDGMLAGVAWPFPVIFTGGVVPGLWRPIVGIDAFDLREDEIDITPFLPLLCDGNPHTFKLVVSGVNETGDGGGVLSETTTSNWPITGKIFMWLDPDNSTTTGSTVTRQAPDPTFSLSSSVTPSSLPNGTIVNNTLTYSISAQRHLHISSTVTTAEGTKNATWEQDLTFSNSGNYTDQGNVQYNTQMTNGQDVSSLNYARSIAYPLYAYQVYETNGTNFSIFANVQRGKDVQTFGVPVFPSGLEDFSGIPAVQASLPTFQGTSLHTTQNGTATYLSNLTSHASFSFGTTEQQMVFAGVSLSGGDSDGYSLNNSMSTNDTSGIPTIAAASELYTRDVLAVNATVVSDDETLIGKSFQALTMQPAPPGLSDFVLVSPLQGATRPSASDVASSGQQQQQQQQRVRRAPRVEAKKSVPRVPHVRGGAEEAKKLRS